MKRALQFALGLLLALFLHGVAAAQSATVMTDQADYAPGTIVTITGTGWQPGETVTLSFVESPLLDTHPDLYATADANGNIFNNQFSPDQHDVNIQFTLTATGQMSGLQAQTTFTDNANVKVTVNGTQTTNPVIAGASTTYGTTPATSVAVAFNGSGACTATLSAAGLPPGGTASFSPASGSADFNSQLTVSTTSAVALGPYTFQVTATLTGAGCGNVTPSGNVTLVVADKLVFGQQPSNTNGAATISPAVTVRVVDANNNLITTGP